MAEAYTPTSMNGAPLRARSQGTDHDLAAVLDALWRRKWIPLLGLAAGVTLGVAALFVCPPVYRASAQIMIGSATGSNVLSFGGTGNGILQSEVEIIESTPVLSKVAGTLGLYRDAEFRRADLADMLILQGNDENALRERVLRRLEEIVRVGVVPGTAIIDITARHANPDRAAQIANAVLAAYQERKVDERFEQSRQMGGWMSKRLEDIKAQGEGAKERLQAFQARHGLIALGGADMKSRRLEVLNADMARVQAQIAALETELEQAKKGRKGKPAQLSSVLESPRINSLKAMETQLAAELADMQQRYGERHPRIIAQKAELARVRGDIAAETRNIIGSIEQDLAIAKGQMDSLQVQISEVTADFDVDGRLKLQLQELESEVAAGERLYADFLIKYQEMMAQTELRDASMKVVSMATIPSRPDQAERLAMIVLLGIAGFFGGLAAVLLRILWNTRFTSAAQLEGMTGYPVFAAVPVAGARGDAVHHKVTQDPAAILAESLRSLRVSLRLRGEGKRTRVVAFTSTLPDEGKTSLAVMLAMIAAKSGERVCVVDCDLRRPSLHKAFGIGNARGLSDYLSDRLSLDEAIHRKDPSGVHLITTKSVPSYSLTLLTSGRMERMIGALREQYDLVILDAPSSLAFADARVLSRMVDQTLYVVAWNRTRRDSVLVSLKAYADMGQSDLALVLNKVDLEEYLRDSASAVVYQYGQEQGAALAT